MNKKVKKDHKPVVLYDDIIKQIIDKITDIDTIYAVSNVSTRWRAFAEKTWTWGRLIYTLEFEHEITNEIESYNEWYKDIMFRHRHALVPKDLLDYMLKIKDWDSATLIRKSLMKVPIIYKGKKILELKIEPFETVRNVKDTLWAGHARTIKQETGMIIIPPTATVVTKRIRFEGSRIRLYIDDEPLLLSRTIVSYFGDTIKEIRLEIEANYTCIMCCKYQDGIPMENKCKLF